MPRTVDWEPVGDDEEWLDEGDPDDEPPAAVADGPAGSSQGWVWVAIAVIATFLVAAVVKLQSPAVTPQQPSVQDPIEFLQAGRRLMIAGRANLKGDPKKGLKPDPEAASYQFRAAIGSFKDGKASSQQIWEARREYALSLAAAGHPESAHSAWGDLLTAAPHKAEAAKARLALEKLLRSTAGKKLVLAEHKLKSGRFQEAEREARESLRLFRGDQGQPYLVGLASGTLGLAELNLHRPNEAIPHLRTGARYYPAGPYAQMLAELRAPLEEPVASPPSRASEAPVVLDGKIGDDTAVPIAKPVVSGGGRKPGPETQPAVEITEPAQPVRTQEIPAAKKDPKPEPKRENNTFDWTDRSQK
jgi:hypothetical protein